jgi:YD repeat-containing protein
MKKYPTIPLLLALLLCLAALPAHAGRITYTYDTNARLTTADYGAETSIAYTYDAGGNLTRRAVEGGTHVLTVTDGTGSGSYPAGKVVAIAANPVDGQIFSAWTGNGADHVANANNPNTTVTMPGADITVQANHKNQPDTEHTLIVTDGTGGGEYKEGTVVNIAAEPREDKVFDKWTGNTTNVANVNIPNTSVIMPGSDVTVRANYTNKPTQNVTLTVNSGTGSGSYAAGRVVRVRADQPPNDQIFDIWTGGTARISDANDPDTTITMPDANVSITATYRDKPNDPFTLTVNEGTGDGSLKAGTVRKIKATVPGGQIFDKWTGQTGRVANPNLPDTTVTMPASNVTVTATFMVKPDQSFTLEQRAYKENQAGAAAMSLDDLVRASTRQAAAEKDPGAWHVISAPNEPGYDFFGWEGQTGNVEDVSSQSTRIYMPASNVTLVAVYTPQQGPAPTAIPTLSEWGLILMSVLMLITGLIMHRRRKQGLM